MLFSNLIYYDLLLNLFQHLINTPKNNPNKQQKQDCKSIQLSKKKFEDIEYVSK